MLYNVVLVSAIHQHESVQTAKLFSKATAPFYILICNRWKKALNTHGQLVLASLKKISFSLWYNLPTVKWCSLKCIIRSVVTKAYQNSEHSHHLWKFPCSFHMSQLLRINCWSDFYQASLVAQMVKNLPAMQKTWVWSSGEANGNPFQYSCLENSVDRGTWWAKVHRLQKIRHDWASKTFTYTLFTVFYHHKLVLPVLEFYLSFGMIFFVVIDHVQES